MSFEPTRDKVEAYRRPSTEAGVARTTCSRSTSVRPSPSGSARPLRAVLLDRGITAAITTRDPLAVALIRGLSELGVRVPEQFAVFAYDNLEWAPMAEPPLSCIGPPRYKMGVAAGEMIVDLIEGRSISWPRVLPTEMVTRRSCGCVWDPIAEQGGPPGASPSDAAG